MATRGMPGIGDATAARVNEELADQQAQLLLRTRTNLEDVKPVLADKEAFEKLLQAVAESTARNESVAAFQARVKALGTNAVKLAKMLSGLMA